MIAIAAAIMVTGIAALAAMPVDALPPTSPRTSASPVPAAGDMMLIGLTQNARGTARLTALAESAIVPRLRRLPGVSAVSAFGRAGPPAAGQVRGDPGLVLIVREAPAAGVFTVSREVDNALAAIAPALRGVSVDASLFRQDAYARSALANARVALVFAAVLTALALLALLLQLRLAFTALFAMALSLVAATAVLDLLGYTFNAIVVLGLLLALAVVVTEATCQAQAIASMIDTGQAPAMRAARLVAAACGLRRGALAAAGLAAVAWVIPLLLATGRTASFLRPMAVAFTLAVVAALVVAVTVTPALAAVLLTIVPPATHGRPLPRLLSAGYARSVTALTNGPRLLMAVATTCAAAGLAGLALLPALHTGQPSFRDRALIAALTGPPRTSLSQMEQLTTRASTELLALPAVQDVGATVGGHSSELWVTLNPSARYEQAVAATRAVARSVPGLAGTVSTSETDAMAGVLTGPNREPLATRLAFICYVIAAFGGVLLLARAATRNWRLAMLAFGSLPVSVSGAVFTAVALGAASELAATAGLLAVFALAARQAIAVTSYGTDGTGIHATGTPSTGGTDGTGIAPTGTPSTDGTDGWHTAPLLAAVLTPAVLTAVAMAPFAAMGDVPGMELLHTAAAVILGGLATTALTGLFVLPAMVPWVARIPQSRRRLASGRI